MIVLRSERAWMVPFENRCICVYAGKIAARENTDETDTNVCGDGDAWLRLR